MMITNKAICALLSASLLSLLSGCGGSGSSGGVENDPPAPSEKSALPPTLDVKDPTPTPSVIWDKAIQDAVVKARPGPTVASRSYGMLHTAMYDAWSAYADKPISTSLADTLQRPELENTDENKMEAMSYAAYQVGIALYPKQKAIFDEVMDRFGYKATRNSRPAKIGRRFAEELLKRHENDGYKTKVSYKPLNKPGVTTFIDRWTPDVVVAQDGNSYQQKFLTPQWGRISTFCLVEINKVRPPAPERFLAKGYESAVVDLEKKTITMDQKVMKIGPELVGTVINKGFIDQANEVIQYSGGLTEKQKLIAEFWEDGNDTSFPPGTWMTIGQYVSNRDNHSLDQDAQLFFMLGNAVFDAGIAVWESKVFYDYARPFAAIRELGKLGLVGKKDAQGNTVIKAYDMKSQQSKTILATDFVTYQMPHSDYSPPFSEYVSGHSGFSAAAATVLKKFTGSDKFGGSYTFESGSSRFEAGVTPKQDLALSWPTFSAAAQEAGMSRLYGGIHFKDGNENGTTLGEKIGLEVYERAQQFIQGPDHKTS